MAIIISQETILEMAEIKILHWAIGLIRKDKIQADNERERRETMGETGVK